MKNLEELELWFITGSQSLYGEAILKNVAGHSREISGKLEESDHIPVKVKNLEVVTTPDKIYEICRQANAADQCVGVVLWMHTFSPAKMWIRGLQTLKKPVLHLHTQYNTEIPWQEIDMDFMNENQSAHGDREFGFMMTRLRKRREVVAGHWKDEEVRKRIGTWARSAAGWHELQSMKVARIGDNMREVAVTEGDKVEAQMRFGFSVNGYGVGDLVEHIQSASEGDVKALLEEYSELYSMNDTVRQSDGLLEAARIESGLRSFLKEGNFSAFTNTFENLHGMKQLPGLAVQRLMADGYGFGAEGDWKTAALVRACKVMAMGLEGGTSFMEDYTYDFGQNKSRVLGAHMLEICPSIASSRPACEIHPLGIGGKDDPARLVFNVDSGPAINVSLIDMGNRFRLLVNEVEAIAPEHELPKLPVARVLWDPLPNLGIAAEAWILGGGAHHTVFSKALTTEFIENLSEMAGIELLVIDKDTQIRNFRDAIRWNEVYYHIFENRN